MIVNGLKGMVGEVKIDKSGYSFPKAPKFATAPASFDLVRSMSASRP